MRKNLEYVRLQRDTVPRICAKTGVPTTRLRKQMLMERRRLAWWWWLVPGNGIVRLIAWLSPHDATIWLPIAPKVLRRHQALRAACVAYVAAFFLVDEAFPLEGVAQAARFYAAIAGLVVLCLITRRAWVNPKWRAGIVVLRDPHPRFVEAVRDVVIIRQPDGSVRRMEQVAKVLPGWYPDPSGAHGYRYWNGGSWTESVMGTPGAAAS